MEKTTELRWHSVEVQFLWKVDLKHILSHFTIKLAFFDLAAQQNVSDFCIEF